MPLIIALLLLISTQVHAEYPWLEGYAANEYDQEILVEYRADGFSVGEQQGGIVTGLVIVDRTNLGRPVYKRCVVFKPMNENDSFFTNAIIAVKPSGETFEFAHYDEGSFYGIAFAGTQVYVYRMIAPTPGEVIKTILTLKPRR